MKQGTALLSHLSPGTSGRAVATPFMLLLLWMTIMQPFDLSTVWGMGYAALVAWLGLRLWEQFGGKGVVPAYPAPAADAEPVQELVKAGQVDPDKVFEATIILQRLQDRGAAPGLSVREILEVLGHLTPRNPHGVRGRQAARAS